MEAFVVVLFAFFGLVFANDFGLIEFACRWWKGDWKGWGGLGFKGWSSRD